MNWKEVFQLIIILAALTAGAIVGIKIIDSHDKNAYGRIFLKACLDKAKNIEEVKQCRTLN